MIAVDAWPPAAVWGRNGERKNLVEIGKRFRAKAESSEYTDRCVVLHGQSADMAWDVDDETLDFVFIDADHSEDAVRADIAAWTPKVKSGGMVLGHDINWPSVRTAVLEAFGDYAAYANNVWGTVKP
jgi:predicted O-methyltransferase YrrM